MLLKFTGTGHFKRRARIALRPGSGDVITFHAGAVAQVPDEIGKRWMNTWPWDFVEISDGKERSAIDGVITAKPTGKKRPARRFGRRLARSLE